jgi:hypothetical protein
MLNGKNKDGFKVSFLSGVKPRDIILILTLMLLGQSVLGRPRHINNTKSDDSNKKVQQIKINAISIDDKQPLNVSKKPDNVTPITRSSKSPSAASPLRSNAAGAGISAGTGRSGFSGINKSSLTSPDEAGYAKVGISQSSKVIPIWRSKGTAIDNKPNLQLQGTINAHTSSSSIKLPGMISSMEKLDTKSIGSNTRLGDSSLQSDSSKQEAQNSNQISLGKTLRVGSPIIAKSSTSLRAERTSVSTIEETPAQSRNHTISSNKTSLIGSPISKQQSLSPRTSKSLSPRLLIPLSQHASADAEASKDKSEGQSKDLKPSKTMGDNTSAGKENTLSPLQQAQGGEQHRTAASLKQTNTTSENHINTFAVSGHHSFINNKKNDTSSTEKPSSTNVDGRINSSESGHLNSQVNEDRTSTTIRKGFNRSIEPDNRTDKAEKNNGIRILRKPDITDKEFVENKTETNQKFKNINLKVVERLRSASRLRKADPGNQAHQPTPHNERPNINKGKFDQPELDGNRAPNDNVINKTDINSSPGRHRGHQSEVRPIHRNEHVYWDNHNQLHHRIIWPKYHFTVCYDNGPYFTFSYVYPYYLRRYIFVSLGGYWPLEYSYIRYYWYSCHPYYWYGYYPIAREVVGDTYNYYTYNYYYGDGATPTDYSSVAEAIKPVDHNTFADVREKLAQQAAKEPDTETPADILFDEAVKAFDAGNYEAAVDKFAEAKELAPDDKVLPFAYAQALLACERYAEAAEVLRGALAKVTPEEEGVFYPRGLYSEDDILFEQIDLLSKKAETFRFDANLQLLLGYQLLGIGEIDKAIEPLQRASQDLTNADSATTLLELAAKMKPDKEAENNE